MGLVYPEEVEKHVDAVAEFLENEHPKLRERSVNALERISRADKNLIIPYLDILMETQKDESEKTKTCICLGM